jgi:uracil-DNA glycosylase
VQEAKPARKRSNDGQEDFNQIPALIRQTAGSSPQKPPLEVLKRASAKCRACDLWKQATQTVFGDGNAGKLLREAMLAAEIDPHDAYLTNVVKHFRWVIAGRGQRRIHKKPRQSEINACHLWLEAELEAVTPKVWARRPQKCFWEVTSA